MANARVPLDHYGAARGLWIQGGLVIEERSSTGSHVMTA
jgi:hypothetical protein